MSRVAIRYAKALLEAAHEKGLATQVGADMLQIAAGLEESRELRHVLGGPTTSSEVKRDILLEVFPGVSAETKGFFRLLMENKRFGILGLIIEEYARQLEEMNGIERAQVTTATAMDKETEARVMSKILEFTNKKIVIENIVDPALIGGFILRVGDRQYNASVASRLEALKREFSHA